MTQTKEKLERKVTLPSGETVDFEHLSIDGDWLINPERNAPLDEFFREVYGSDWPHILKMQEQLMVHIKSLRWRPNSYTLSFVGKENGLYVFRCGMYYECPSDPGTITREYKVRPTITVEEERIVL